MAINSHAEGITIYFEGNTIEFDKSAANIKKALELLQKETKALQKEFKNTGDIEKFKQAVLNLKDEQIVAARSVQAWADEVAKAKREHGAFSKEYVRAIKEWQTARDRLASIGVQIQKNEELLARFTSPEDIQKMAEAFENVGGKLENIGDIAGNVAQALSGMSRMAQDGLKKAAENAIAYESAFADVKKTVDETNTTSYVALSAGLRQLSKEVPVAADELARIAGLAGQMNVPADDIIAFTKAMVDFGNSTNITAEQATEDIAQIYNVIGKGGDFSTLDNLLSVIVDLGNNSATTEKDITEMLRNISASASRVGMTEQQMAALAATLASLGLDKGGASAISTLMTKIDMAVSTNADSLKDWADAAGVSVSNFRKLWQDDAAGALATLLDNLRKTADEGGNLNEVFADLNIKEMRRIDTMGRLVNANDVYRDAMDRANAAFEDGTALTEEANKRYDTLESKIQIMRNTFEDFALTIGNMFMPIMEKVVDVATKFADFLGSLPPKMQGVIAGIGVLLAVVAPLAGVIAVVAAKIAPFIKTVLPRLIMTNTKLFTALKSVGNAVKFLTSPIGILIGIFTALALTNEETREMLNRLAKMLTGVFKNAWTIIVNVIRIAWEIFTGLVETIRYMWAEFQKTEIGQGFINIIKAVITFVSTLVGWLETLTGWLGKVLGFFADALGMAHDLNDTTNELTIRGRQFGNGYDYFQSGGFASDGFMANGMTFNNTFTITGINNIDQDTANRLADMMTNRINTNLGRMYS